MIYWSEVLSQSEVTFVLQHRIIADIRMKLKEFNLDVICDREDFDNAKITFKANPLSIELSKHSREVANNISQDFTHLKLGKEVSFSSTKFSKTEKDFIYKLDGMLTLNDIVKPVCLSALLGSKSKDSEGNDRCIFKFTGSIDRKDWLIDLNLGTENDSTACNDEVLIECKIQLIKSNVVSEVLPSITEQKEISDDMRISL